MFSVFVTSYRLRITYRVNSIIYSLKQLPLVRRLLPAALYRSRGLKRFACVIAVLMEIIGMFLQKGMYLGLVVLAPATQMLAPDAWLSGFLHILLLLSIAGAVSNNRLFDPTRDKYYAIILMRMPGVSPSATISMSCSSSSSALRPSWASAQAWASCPGGASSSARCCLVR